jgi:hypothetical protein
MYMQVNPRDVVAALKETHTRYYKWVEQKAGTTKEQVRKGNHIDEAEVLANLAGDALAKGNQKKYLTWALIASICILVVLLCTSFASVWLALSLHQQINTDDTTNTLRSQNTGQVVATRHHIENILIDIDFEAITSLCQRSRLRQDRNPDGQHEDDKIELIRSLQETPLFTVPAQIAHGAWSLYADGNLGTLQITSSTTNGTDIVLSSLDTKAVQRFEDGSSIAVTYGPLSRQAEPEVMYYISCPIGDEGTCGGFPVNAKEFAGRRLNHILPCVLLCPEPSRLGRPSCSSCCWPPHLRCLEEERR